MSKTILNSAEYLDVTYSEEKAPYGEYPFLFGKHLLKDVFGKTGKILDLGCGRGEYVKVFSDLGFEPTGIDISPRTVELLSDYEVYATNLEEGITPGELWKSYDFVFSKSVIEHMNNPMGLLKVAYESLSDDGTAVIMTPSWAHNYKNAFYIDHTHVTPFTRASLEDALKMAGFAEVEVKYFYQLPTLWKFPWLKYFSKLFSYLPIPYAPLDPVPWSPSAGLNKYVRFSKEVMLMAVAKK
tara:strand:- start:494 stop:1213 length:720 start_codon:yes stop_codon:yes gene_type:complete